MGLHAQQAADLLLAIEREHPQCMQEVSMYHDDHSRSRSSAAAAIEGDGGGGGGGGGGHTYRELERGRERWGAVQQCARGGRNALIPFIMQLLTTILVASDRIAKIDAAAGTWEPVVHLAISADGTVEVDLLICELEPPSVAVRVDVKGDGSCVLHCVPAMVDEDEIGQQQLMEARDYVLSNLSKDEIDHAILDIFRGAGKHFPPHRFCYCLILV
jgi:hypothetical protein